MWPFKRRKTIRGLAGGDRIALSDGGVVSIDEILASIEGMAKDIGTCITAINRVERKQIRWLETLNAKEDEAANILSTLGQDGKFAKVQEEPGNETPGLAGEPTEE